MANRDLLVIGTSAGGVPALQALARGFRRDLPASVLITIHLAKNFRSRLDQILSSVGPLAASFAEDGEPMRRGHIYIAPPGRHLLAEVDRLVLGDGPPENGSLPAIDPMLRSVARCCGGRTVGVVLTGLLGDGASGLWSLGQSGGVTVVQDPRDAAFGEMPVAAINRITPDHVVTLAEMPSLLDSLVRQSQEPTSPASDRLNLETEVARTGVSTMDDMDRIGRRSTLSCPDCGGVMWEIAEGDLARFRCHIGHAYTAELMSLAQDSKLREAFAAARRGFHEKVALMRRLEGQALASGHARLARIWHDRLEGYRDQADLIEDSLKRLERLASPPASGIGDS